eukprot:TRINITY_DN10637_c0_g1_i2.p2 TRINITY_DN10637_c0_g1~~TRINITY_DN10637_c0_g1_i2.p2  ORF type:complete len:135 (+),score=45.09 TRINITY_DN10637_c0_g1_i2:95-499(+)
MIRRPPRSTLSSSSAASDVYKRQYQRRVRGSPTDFTMNLKLLVLACCLVLGLAELDSAARDERLYKAWRTLDSDFDGLKQLYAPEASFLIALGENPVVEGNWDEAMAPFKPVLTKFYTVWHLSLIHISEPTRPY